MGPVRSRGKENELGDEPFFGAKKFGFLEKLFIGFCCWLYSYEMFASFSIETECPKLVAWSNRCMEKERVSKSLPDPRKVYGVVLELKERWA
ncbi:hypothetical protein EUGRSUZ_L01849 [Eucalyptus grandis]|uniref:GST C-terminal domain-containing protein n=1 Tax=Eucalyptus grandis TaxID=71139 RepID=A0A058ZT65_EUCGR|nr:hypothetical protein EUGRSUZ_L01849 [Eucalyptus grandis]